MGSISAFGWTAWPHNLSHLFFVRQAGCPGTHLGLRWGLGPPSLRLGSWEHLTGCAESLQNPIFPENHWPRVMTPELPFPSSLSAASPVSPNTQSGAGEVACHLFLYQFCFSQSPLWPLFNLTKNLSTASYQVGGGLSNSACYSTFLLPPEAQSFGLLPSSPSSL